MPFLKEVNSLYTKEAFGHYFKNEEAKRGAILAIEDYLGDRVYILAEGKIKVEKKY